MQFPCRQLEGSGRGPREVSQLGWVCGDAAAPYHGGSGTADRVWEEDYRDGERPMREVRACGLFRALGARLLKGCGGVVQNSLEKLKDLRKRVGSPDRG